MQIPAGLNGQLMLLLLLTLETIWAATIVHGADGAALAISHQSFVRTSRILNMERQRIESRLDKEEQLKEFMPKYHTPAHLTFAARPVLHQMLPQIKPVRNLSYASLRPGPRSLS